MERSRYRSTQKALDVEAVSLLHGFPHGVVQQQIRYEIRIRYDQGRPSFFAVSIALRVVRTG